jgi:hypothetical protein
MEHIRRATQMDPDNPDYQRFYQVVQSGGRMYSETGSQYGFHTNQNFCYPMCVAWCLLNACCGGRYGFFCC